MPTRAETSANVRRWLQSWGLDDTQLDRFTNLVTDSMHETGNLDPDNHQLFSWVLGGLALWLNPTPLDDLLGRIPAAIPLTDGTETKPAREWCDLVIDLRGDDVSITLQNALMIDGRIHLVNEEGNMNPDAYLTTEASWMSRTPA